MSELSWDMIRYTFRYTKMGIPRVIGMPRRWAYYRAGQLRAAVPARFYRARLASKLQFSPAGIDAATFKQMADARVTYYCKLRADFSVSAAAMTAEQLGLPKNNSNRSDYAYAMDLQKHLRHFPPTRRFDYCFGDVTELFATPTIVKSRPIGDANMNSVVLKLDQIRHYYFVRDRRAFRSKIGRAVWRGNGRMPHRLLFLEQCHNHPLCDVGHINPSRHGIPQAWRKSPLGIPEQLAYKYIVVLEGYDVASSLKWAMSANSLCMMTKPKYETWFMEGQLIAGQHYVQLRDDYADLAEKIEFYEKHPEHAEAIIANANRYTRTFQQNAVEDLVSLLVLRKYFRLSGTT